MRSVEYSVLCIACREHGRVCTVITLLLSLNSTDGEQQIQRPGQHDTYIPSRRINQN